MSKPFAVLLVSALAFVVSGAGATAQTADGHKVISSQDVKWNPGPPSLPPGSQVALLFGDPSKEGMFAFRIKVPNGYSIPPHTHPKPEVVTVISGTMWLGMGNTADRSKAQALPAGSFFALEPGLAHYVHAEGETVVQLNSTGPWSISYVNPKDDPQQR